jgi:hypothetical protein
MLLPTCPHKHMDRIKHQGSQPDIARTCMNSVKVCPAGHHGIHGHGEDAAAHRNATLKITTRHNAHCVVPRQISELIVTRSISNGLKTELCLFPDQG